MKLPLPAPLAVLTLALLAFPGQADPGHPGLHGGAGAALQAVPAGEADGSSAFVDLKRPAPHAKPAASVPIAAAPKPATHAQRPVGAPTHAARHLPSAGVMHRDQVSMLPPSAVGMPLQLFAGRSRLIAMSNPLVRVAVGDPKVADVLVLSKREILLQAIKPGVTTLLVWTQRGLTPYDVQVGLDAAAVQSQILAVTGNPGLKVTYSGGGFLLTGEPSSAAQKDQAEKIANSYGVKVVDLAVVPVPRQQIAIDVHVIELARNAALNLGVAVGGAQGTPSSYVFKPGQLQMGEAVTGNLGSMSQLDFLSLKIDALQSRGEAKLLAHPTLVTTEGGTAKFLAGGEVPIPIEAALGQTTIMWKEFGVKLEVLPTRTPDGRIAMTVKPEVSSLDFSAGLKQASYTVPAVKTRRAETQVVLAPDETLMLGGLMDADQSRSYSALPGLGEIPVLGELFKSRDFQDNQSELAIFVRPRLIAPEGDQHLPGALPDVQRDLSQELPAAAPSNADGHAALPKRRTNMLPSTPVSARGAH